MKRARDALIATALLGFEGCSKVPPDPYDPISVADARDRLGYWNGRTVSVRGWLTDPCGEMSCAIFPMRTKVGQEWPDKPYLSIASETLVEPALVANAGSEVILRGVLSDECISYNCSDRAPDITPIAIRRLPVASKEH